ncbi:hypothetical protein AB1Y20_012199 [Prymnesium parvum]
MDARIQTDKWTSPQVFHCHILEHEDEGMMGVTLITGTEGTLDLRGGCGRSALTSSIAARARFSLTLASPPAVTAHSSLTLAAAPASTAKSSLTLAAANAVTAHSSLPLAAAPPLTAHSSLPLAAAVAVAATAYRISLTITSATTLATQPVTVASISASTLTCANLVRGSAKCRPK